MMKKIVIIVLLLISGVVSGQTTRSLYLATQPFDLGIGLRYDICYKAIGGYGSVSYGNGYLYRMSGLQHHIKSTVGLMISPSKKHDFYVTAGANYHYVNTEKAEGFIIGTPIMNKWSFELGVTRVIVGRFIVGLRTDILRWEPCMDIGIILK